MITSRTPTTFEMDGLLTQEDIDNRHFIMTLCKKCKNWTKHNTRHNLMQNPDATQEQTESFGRCSECGSGDYDHNESRSVRSWEATRKK